MFRDSNGSSLKRMKTANLALRPAILLSLVAGLTVAVGVLAPPSTLAQDGPAQTDQDMTGKSVMADTKICVCPCRS